MTNNPALFPAYCLLCEATWEAFAPHGLDPMLLENNSIECPDCGLFMGRPQEEMKP